MKRLKHSTSFRSLYFALVIGSTIGFISACKNSDDNSITIPEELEDYYEFQGLDLTEHGLNATIMLPDETANIGASTKPEIFPLYADYYWNIHVGNNFHLYIEDQGDNTNLVAERKKAIENTPFFEVNYLIDEDSLIVYERTLKVRGHAKASDAVGVKHVSYHVYGEKVINGIHYELRSREEGFDKKYIELMAKSIRSFKAKK